MSSNGRVTQKPGAKKETIGKLIYLAGPIDAVSHGTACAWRTKARKELEQYVVATFSPSHGWGMTGLDQFDEYAMKKLIECNDFIIHQSDALLVSLDGPSIGTPVELQLAYQLSVPVISFGGHGRACLFQHLLGDWYPTRTEAVEAMAQKLELPVIAPEEDLEEVEQPASSEKIENPDEPVRVMGKWYPSRDAAIAEVSKKLEVRNELTEEEKSDGTISQDGNFIPGVDIDDIFIEGDEPQHEVSE